ncbi:GNAT family N-acetyltransferase [Bacteroidales bacterium OttesenSCG-928-I21]|nr:GNAT family N-acetyltransferase [Bacteroidales bacterium OttesenSCG-928-I21]
MEGIGKILENKTIYLRKVEPEDIDFLYSIENDPNIWFVSETKTPFSRWQIKEHIKNSAYDIYTIRELRLIIEITKTREQVGIVDLFDFDPFNLRAGIGIVVSKKFQNQNIASEALETTINYCIKILKINQLWCNIDSENTRSINLFNTKFGFKHNGNLKSWKKNGNIFSDVYFYQLIFNES